MKPVLFLVCSSLCAALFAATLVPVSAQNDAGTPPLTPNMAVPLPQVLKLPEKAQPGTLTTNKPQYKAGQPVRITFRVVNTSGKAVIYNFSTGQRFDITATWGKGVTVWAWSSGRVFSQNLASVTLAPGKALVFPAVWNGRRSSGSPAAPGTYTLSAHLTSDNQPAITGGVIVNTDPDPTNMGVPTRTPAESGAIRQVDPAPQVSAKTTIVIR
ncbi:MAG: BsuPI-related putative proteinase inhibitor [Janthinobacterium lividum]